MRIILCITALIALTGCKEPIFPLYKSPTVASTWHGEPKPGTFNSRMRTEMYDAARNYNQQYR